jgi:type IV pilus assembly protein PilO
MAGLPTNRRDQIMLVVCIAAVAMIYVFYQYFYTPKGAQLDTLQTRVEALQASNESVRQEIARGTAGKLKEEADMYGRMLVLMRQLVPVSNEVPALLDQISNAARQVGLELGPIRPLGVIPGEVFDTYRYNMGVSGSYHRIGQFLDNVGSLTRIMAPMNLTLRRNEAPRPGQRARSNEQLLDAGFEIQTYVLKVAPAGRPAVAAPSGQ